MAPPKWHYFEEDHPVLTSRRAPGRPTALGLIAAMAISILPGSTVQPALAISPDIVISEVYGGGGNSGAPLTHDYIELYNRGSAPASLNGWSVQYASATGTGNLGANASQLTDLPNVTLQPGQYFLIQEAAGATPSGALPTPDLVDPTPISLSGTAGKVAVANTAVSLGCNGGSAPCSPAQLGQIVDLVGYGNANFFEGAAAAPTLSNTTSAIRVGDGNTDTDNNSADFAAGPPDPDPGADAAPTVSSTVPANTAVGVSPDSNLTVTFSEPVNATTLSFTVNCAASGVHAVGVSASPATTFTVDPAVDFAANESCAVVVVASQVTDLDASDPPDNMLSDVTFSFMTGAPVDPCADPYTPIPQIQGSGPIAAITGNVITEGVVVGDFEGASSLQGFYLQDVSGDADTTTSDGIFVFTGSATNVASGDLVRVTGFARERFGTTTLNGSDSNSVPVTTASIVACGTGSVSATDVTLPFVSLDYPERFEGMLVNLPQALVISEYFNYERFGELVLAQPLPGEDRPFTPTSIVEPGAPANARALANSLSRITLDDGLGIQNPPSVRHPNGDPFSLTNRFRGGDTVRNTVGVMGFDFNLYRIQPTGPAEYTSVNPRPAAPDPVGGTLRAAAMNTLNFFLTLDYPTGNPLDNKCGGNQNLECRGADFDQPTEFTRQRDKLLAALAGMNADVIGLNEIENTPGVEPLLDPANGVVAGLNAMPGVGPYAAIDTGVIGTDAIRVGLIYRTDKVAPVGTFKILDSTVDPRFIDTKSRPVLAQTFEDLATGARFTVAVNHLKSKGSDCLDVGDPDLGDGQGNCNRTRKEAAQALVDWLATDPTESGDRDYLILGDLNSYAQEDPIDAVRAGADDTPNTSDDYTNLIAKYQGTYAHSYVFDGQAGYLDYAMASSTLVGQVTGAADWHINSDEPDLLDYDTSFKPPEQDAIYEPNAYRASDHDPVIVGLKLLNYRFRGFLRPVDNPPAVNTVKAGLPIPLSFLLARGLGRGVLFETPTSATFDCSTGTPTGQPEPTTTLGNIGLIHIPGTGFYSYVWRTQRAWAQSCRTFSLTLDDGTYRTADFHLRR